MLYDWTGRPVPEGKPIREVIADRLVHWEYTDRDESDASRALTPAKLDSYLRQANTGDTESQARLALEIEEKDWDTVHALGTRRAAVLGLERRIEPGIEDDAQAQKIADEAETMLAGIAPEGDEDVDFEGAIEHLLSGILPGYACMEILWGEGGGTIQGFAPVMTSAITFHQSKRPLLATRPNPLGVPLAPNKFVFHRHRARSGDATRGGLIRPLGWMYLFENLGVKDLMRFTEKFGMPFVAARIDESAWDQDRTKIAYLIRNFGSDGGAVFSKAVELEMLQSNATNGELYFKLLEYFGDAKTKVLLGQTATSGDAGGFSKGQAQAAVRQDILEADCKAVSATVRSDILRPWTMFRYGPDAPVPYLHLEYEPPEDLKAKAEMIKILHEAGYQVDPEHVKDEFGMPLTLKPVAAGIPGEQVALAGEKKKSLSSLRHSQRTSRW